MAADDDECGSCALRRARDEERHAQALDRLRETALRLSDEDIAALERLARFFKQDRDGGKT